MNREIILAHEFVEYIPGELQEATIYVSIAFATAVHKCCCGCGNEVVTPLSPTDWEITFNGASISLDPSIGNWSFDCQSHYWIKRNKVIWAPRWTQKEIAAGRSYDQLAKEHYYADNQSQRTPAMQPTVGERQNRNAWESLWKNLKKWLRL